jgi:hypothetical protein
MKRFLLKDAQLILKNTRVLSYTDFQKIEDFKIVDDFDSWYDHCNANSKVEITEEEFYKNHQQYFESCIENFSGVFLSSGK